MTEFYPPSEFDGLNGSGAANPADIPDVRIGCEGDEPEARQVEDDYMKVPDVNLGIGYDEEPYDSAETNNEEARETTPTPADDIDEISEEEFLNNPEARRAFLGDTLADDFEELRLGDEIETGAGDEQIVIERTTTESPPRVVSLDDIIAANEAIEAAADTASPPTQDAESDGEIYADVAEEERHGSSGAANEALPTPAALIEGDLDDPPRTPIQEHTTRYNGELMKLGSDRTPAAVYAREQLVERYISEGVDIILSESPRSTEAPTLDDLATAVTDMVDVDLRTLPSWSTITHEEGTPPSWSDIPAAMRQLVVRHVAETLRVGIAQFERRRDDYHRQYPRLEADTVQSSTADEEVTYAHRQAVPAEQRDWATPAPDYHPPELTTEWVKTTGVELGVSDPESPTEVDFSQRPSFMGDYSFDDRGRPLNPTGRQGLEGRGDLSKWGPNNAADPVVVATDPETNDHKILLIRRQDTGAWALPGGMVDPGEHVSKTATRELREEANIDLSGVEGEVVDEGYVDDPRNTDNSWIETSARLFEISYTPEPRAGDDAADARWFGCNTLDELKAEIRALEDMDPSQNPLYASHDRIIEKALRRLDR